jgi:hypothetical protein
LRLVQLHLLHFLRFLSFQLRCFIGIRNRFNVGRTLP